MARTLTWAFAGVLALVPGSSGGDCLRGAKNNARGIDGFAQPASKIYFDEVVRLLTLA